MNATVTSADEDVRFIEKIVNGDRDALGKLYEKHHKRVFHFIRRFEDNVAIAEDLANDVFIDIWHAASKFEGRSKVSSWILGMARFKVLAEQRKMKRTVDPDDALNEIEDDADTPEMSVQKMSKKAALKLCIKKLTKEHRVVIDLIYYHSKSIKEVAEILDVPQNTVKTRTFHARKALSTLMSEAGLDRGWP
jgi:RNA polymerase sigma-70 factor (ECF subfamily)